MQSDQDGQSQPMQFTVSLPTDEIAQRMGAQCTEAVRALLANTQRSDIAQELEELLEKITVLSTEIGKIPVADHAHSERMLLILRTATAHMHDLIRAVEFKSRIQQLYEGPHHEDVMSRTLQHLDKLKSKYENSDAYQMYHVLADKPAGDLPSHSADHKFDFPEKDSVSNFIEKLEQEFGSKKKQ